MLLSLVHLRPRHAFLISIIAAGRIAGQELNPEQIYRQVAPSVMTLQVENLAGERYVGTAFLAIKEGVAVTAWHVVADARRVTARFGDNLFADVLGVIDKDERSDLALVRVRISDRARVRLATADPAIGARAYVIGAPKGYDFSITDGLVSQIRTVAGIKQYQISCPISEGNSGGPVVNERGEIIGVTAWTQADANNLSFAIPAAGLSALKPSLACKSWTELSKANTVARHASAAKEPRNRVRTADPESTWSHLKNMLGDTPGEEVSVIVLKHGEARCFNFVPRDRTAGE